MGFNLVNIINDKLNMKQVGSISNTRTAINNVAIEPNQTVVVAEVKKECLLQDIKTNFPEDIKALFMKLEIYNGATWENFYVLAHDYNTVTHRIFPSTGLIGNTFETLANNAKDKVVVLRMPMRVKGFRLTLTNELLVPKKVTAFVMWSEV